MGGERSPSPAAEGVVQPRAGGAEPGAAAAHEVGDEASEARLRAIVDQAVDGIITIDEAGLIQDVNPAVLRLFGYQPQELIGRNVKVLMPDPYRREHDDYLRNYRVTGQPKIIGIGREVAGRRKDGSVFPLELSVSEVQYGKRRLFTGIVRDVTERKRVEAERQRFVSLVENSSDFIATATLSWEVLYINKAGQRLIGAAPEQVTRLEVRDLWHESTLPRVIREVLPAQRRGESCRFQGQVKHLISGEPIDVDCNAFAILDPDTGRPDTIAFSLRDIREQKQAEQALRDSEARLAAILDSAVDGIVTIGEQGEIEAVNPTARSIFGYSSEQLIGQNVNILMPEPFYGEHDQYLRNYRHTGERKIIGIGREVLGRRQDGTVFPIDLSVSEVQLGDRRLFTGIIRDITERKEADRHRNLLVAELSHRVKNMLATVISIAQQTFKPGQPMESSRAAFEGRLLALSKTHNRLAESDWRGARLDVVILDEVSPYCDPDVDSVRIAGPPVSLDPRLAVSLGMAFHELATNAAKHGALAHPGGSIDVSWELRSNGRSTRYLTIRWVERGVPGLEKPTRSGFGRLLLERGLAHDLKGKVHLDFGEEGLRCTIVCPL